MERKCSVRGRMNELQMYTVNICSARRPTAHVAPKVPARAGTGPPGCIMACCVAVRCNAAQPVATGCVATRGSPLQPVATRRNLGTCERSARPGGHRSSSRARAALESLCTRPKVAHVMAPSPGADVGAVRHGSCDRMDGSSPTLCRRTVPCSSACCAAADPVGRREGHPVGPGADVAAGPYDCRAGPGSSGTARPSNGFECCSR